MIYLLLNMTREREAGMGYSELFGVTFYGKKQEDKITTFFVGP